MLKTIFAATCLMVIPVAVFAAGETFPATPEKGEAVFRKCMACHAVGEDAKNKVGPMLNSVIGRTAGAARGFQLFRRDGGRRVRKAWSGRPKTLDAFLEKPRDYVEGTKMSFAGLRKEEERQDVIAYLATFSRRRRVVRPAISLRVSGTQARGIRPTSGLRTGSGCHNRGNPAAHKGGT